MPPPFSSKMSTKVVAFKDSSSNSEILTPPAERKFSWVFRPLLLWMRLFGIPLLDIKPAGIKSTKSTRFLILLAYALAVYVTEICVICSSIAGKVEASFSKQNQTVASLVNGEVTFYNYMITIMLAHTGLLLVTATRWDGVVRSLLQLERNRYCWFSNQDYQKFRNTFVIGSGFLLLVNILN